MKTPQVTPDWKTGIYIGNGQIVSDTTVEDTVEYEKQIQELKERLKNDSDL